ncbi:peptide chain release factor N(5)-glutamine methyltransferase [Patescibacteria group bacterium]|nr:peptide chain release factor N(5)-glutamine methyltransferase [Patescibacteria group bacterium]
MNISQALAWAKKQLNTARIETPDLDAEVLLAHTLRKDRVFLFSHAEKALTKKTINKFKEIIRRRKHHEPIAYITGFKYFYKIPISVSKNALIPRPETELLVALGLEYISETRREFTIMEIGTGSGAVAVALAKNQNKARVMATDVSKKALGMARKNAKRQRVKIEFMKSDLLKKFIGHEKIWQTNLNILLLANLPYLPTRVWKKTPMDVKKFEPRQALDGGADGLKYYKELINQLEHILPKLKSFQAFWEIDPTQEKALKKILKQSLKAKNIKIYPDLCGRTRMIGWTK